MIARKDIYQLTKEESKPILGKLILAYLLVSVITSSITGVAIAPTLTKIFNMFYAAANNPANLDTVSQQLLNISSQSIIPLAIASILEAIITTSFVIAIYQYVKEKDFKVTSFLNVLKENFLKILVVSTIYALGLTVLSLIPSIATFIQLFYKLIFAYYAYLIVDRKDLTYLEIFKESYNLTKGHKVNLFVISLRYTIRVMIVGAIMLIVSLPFLTSLTYNSLQYVGALAIIFSITALASLIVSLYYFPQSLLAQAIYYNEQIKELEEITSE